MTSGYHVHLVKFGHDDDCPEVTNRVNPELTCIVVGEPTGILVNAFSPE